MRAGLASPYVLLLLGCLVVTGAVAVAVWRQRPSPGATALVALLAALFGWTATYAVGLVTYDPAARLLLERVMWIAVTTIPVAWLAFALAYTGRRRWVNRRVLGGLLVVPALVTGLVLTNPAHHLVWATNERTVAGGVSIAVQTYGPVFWPFALYSYALVLAGAYLLLRLAFTTEELYPDQAVALVVGAVVPTVANYLSVTGRAPLAGFDMTPYAFTVSGVAFGYALVRYDLFEFVPATRYLGRDAVVDNMRDVVLIVDDEHRIVETNPAAERVFEFDRGDVLGEPLDAVLDVEGEPALPPPGVRREIATERGGRTFEMTASAIDDWQDRTIGHVLVFRDVTERLLREQRLGVLNRVLRHNLRNDLSVVDGHAELLADELSGPPAEQAELIRDTAAGLLDVSEKAREVDRVVEGDDAPEEVDLVTLVGQVVEAVRQEYPEVTFETDVPGRLPLTCANPGLVGIAVRNLVENAAEHNDREDPRVTVALGGSAGERVAATLVVADNGPAIPRQEREALDAGVETSLRHGSGLGLWIVDWCVRRLGGELSIETTDGGNRVEVRLPTTAARAAGAGDAVVAGRDEPE